MSPLETPSRFTPVKEFVCHSFTGPSPDRGFGHGKRGLGLRGALGPKSLERRLQGGGLGPISHPKSLKGDVPREGGGMRSLRKQVTNEISCL